MSATLQVIHSGSAANGYILTCGNDKLIIEAGCKSTEYLRALNYDITQVKGILITHCHTDHSRSIRTLQDTYALQVYAPSSVRNIYPKCHSVEHMKRYMIGGFAVMPLSVEHSIECVAYVIDHPDIGRLVFATDCTDFAYKIPNVNYVMCETNYCDDKILDNLCNGLDVRSQFDNHMSLGTAVSVIKRLQSPRLSKVVCLHLSDGNASESAIKERIFNETGIRPIIAESGLKICLDDDF